MDYPKPQWSKAVLQPAILADDVRNYNDVGELSNKTDHDSKCIYDASDESESVRLKENLRMVLSM